MLIGSSSTVHHICGIICGSTNSKMSRIYTTSVITAVQNPIIFCYSLTTYVENESVCPPFFSLPSTNTDRHIAFSVGGKVGYQTISIRLCVLK